MRDLRVKLTEVTGLLKMLSGTPQKLSPICNVKYNATNLALSNLDNALYQHNAEWMTNHEGFYCFSQNDGVSRI